MFILLIRNVQSQMNSSVQNVGIAWSLLAPVRPPTSVCLPHASSPLPSDTSQSESEISQCDYGTPDLDTNAPINVMPLYP